jgi:membrane protein implicated in regulation of membrane protease activity
MRSMRARPRRASGGNRTRTLFFVFIAIMLGVIAFSLSAQIINSAVLMQIYIAATILGVGVVVVDMMGLLGSQHGDEGGAYDSAGHDGGHDGGDYGGFGHDDGSDDGGMDADSAGWDDAGDAHDAHAHDDAPLHEVDHDSPLPGGGPVLEAIRYLRMFVYFCLGFGLVGLGLLTSGRTAQASLLFAGAAGFGAVLLARAFYRFQPRGTGDVMPSTELLREQGIVTVPFSHETMGKVRVQVGMQVQEVYALAAEEGKEFARGATVRIVQVGDDCVYVEEV